MITRKSSRKLRNGAMATIAAMPLFRRKSSSVSDVMPYVLGTIGVAVLGGLAALMIFSPRTRYRAFGAAKQTYGKVTDRIGHTRIGERLGILARTNHPDDAATSGL